LEDKKDEIKEQIKNNPPKGQCQKIDIFVNDSKTSDFINAKSNNNLELKNGDKLIKKKILIKKKHIIIKYMTIKLIKIK
jgi:hypothetical protein